MATLVKHAPEISYMLRSLIFCMIFYCLVLAKHFPHKVLEDFSCLFLCTNLPGHFLLKVSPFVMKLALNSSSYKLFCVSLQRIKCIAAVVWERLFWLHNGMTLTTLV